MPPPLNWEDDPRDFKSPEPSPVVLSKKSQLNLRRMYPHACPVCLSTTLRSNSELRRHLYRMHCPWLEIIQDMDKSEKRKPLEEFAGNMWIRPPHCSVCFADFSSWLDVEEHWKSMHLKDGKHADPPVHAAWRDDSVLPCPVCRVHPRSFLHFFTDHQHTCVICLSRFWDKDEVKSHFDQKHAQWIRAITVDTDAWRTVWERQDPCCPTCAKSFKTWSAAQIHHEMRKCSPPRGATNAAEKKDARHKKHRKKKRSRSRSPVEKKSKKHGSKNSGKKKTVDVIVLDD
jgi:hypothetical protein